MTLWSGFLTNKQRIVHKWAHYFPVYERHFGRFRDTDVLLFEIGCGQGGSLQMWKRYFGPHAKIVGIDNRSECKDFEEDQINIRIGDQADSEFLLKLCEEFGAPDIVIDDGSHVMDHVNASFLTLYPKLTKAGVYLVEDLHTAYWDKYGGGLRRNGTFIERCKDLIDELNAEAMPEALTPTEFTRTTVSMHLYAGVVVFEKGQTGVKRAVKTGKRAPKAGKRSPRIERADHPKST